MKRQHSFHIYHLSHKTRLIYRTRWYKSWREPSAQMYLTLINVRQKWGRRIRINKQFAKARYIPKRIQWPRTVILRVTLSHPRILSLPAKRCNVHTHKCNNKSWRCMFTSKLGPRQGNNGTRLYLIYVSRGQQFGLSNYWLLWKALRMFRPLRW